MFFKRREEVQQGLDFHDVLIVPRQSKSPYKSRRDVTLKPRIIVANMEGIGTIEMSNMLERYRDKLNVQVCLTRDQTEVLKHNLINHRLSWLKDNSVENLGVPQIMWTISENNQDHLGMKYPVVIDVANAYRQAYIDCVKQKRKTYPNTIFVAGNVCTYEGAMELFKAGADAVKVGIGSGTVCLTRQVTGIGCPQVTAVMECRRAADDYTRKTKKKVYIISDGGVQVPGDVVKAYVAGADYVMIGGLFAKAVGGSFSGSSVINDGHVYKTSEGKTVKLPQYTQEQKYANLKSLVESIVAGVNSAATYLGAESIEDFRKKGKFIRVTRQLNNMFN